MTLRMAALGIDHRHIFGQAGNMIAAGAEFAAWWTARPTNVEAGFVKRFPDVPKRDKAEILADPSIELILISAIPAERAALAIEAMRAGKDVMVDKPGCVTLTELADLRRVQQETGRIWSIDFSERFEVPAVTRAAELVAEGAIGRVVQTLGQGPHRLNRQLRPDWFFDRAQYGGILADIASHQIDQFLFFTGAQQPRVVAAHVANHANPESPGLQDFGEILLRSEAAHGYVRVDWFTPDALPTWGDGRLTILGTEGYIELRKYVDVARSDATDHLFLVNGSRCEHIDARDAGLPYFPRLIDDIRTRGETAMPQAHAFTVMELALQAQAMAEAEA
ncbi:Gfo/Idh/MocA family oxidoreductase [Roseivivax sp. GX 12232]|uniref:Gfo/Idh/MocA family protein n=1 Tax=Roseivivax sp. GX 12232 TaxID=2900547 RepID=UPI001E601B90|nr:Gfo/Idh/MocA family oxidoreductase [Roseivivax sp. GX 12232]MCE0504110.1 Gfo/Idh/MocA family oxidoreductase [Roseivivax sp. GX 12232]